jgi:hypothetical protein
VRLRAVAVGVNAPFVPGRVDRTGSGALRPGGRGVTRKRSRPVDAGQDPRPQPIDARLLTPITIGTLADSTSLKSHSASCPSHSASPPQRSPSSVTHPQPDNLRATRNNARRPRPRSRRRSGLRPPGRVAGASGLTSSAPGPATRIRDRPGQFAGALTPRVGEAAAPVHQAVGRSLLSGVGDSEEASTSSYGWCQLPSRTSKGT